MRPSMRPIGELLKRLIAENKPLKAKDKVQRRDPQMKE